MEDTDAETFFYSFFSQQRNKYCGCSNNLYFNSTFLKFVFSSFSTENGKLPTGGVLICFEKRKRKIHYISSKI